MHRAPGSGHSRPSLSPVPSKNDERSAYIAVAPTPEMPSTQWRSRPWLRIDVADLSNTYYAFRVAMVALVTLISMTFVWCFRTSSVEISLWVILGSLNGFLAIAAVPGVQLFSATDPSTSTAQAETRKQHQPFISFSRFNMSNAVTNLQSIRLKRSLCLRVGEFLVIIQIVVLALVLLFVILVLWLLRVTFLEALSEAQLLAIYASMCVSLQMTSFDNIRAYQQLQLGAGLDLDELQVNNTNSARAAISNSSADLRTTNICELPSLVSIVDTHRTSAPSRRLNFVERRRLRQQLYEAVANNDHATTRSLLRETLETLGSKMQLEMLLHKMYSTPTLWLWSFAFTTYNPLHVACRLGDVEMVQLLLNHGLNPNLLDKIAGEPLTLRQIFEMCRGRPANITNVVASPLHVAVMHGHTEVIDVLARYNANMDLIAKTSWFSKSMRVPPVFVADAADVMECLIRHRTNFLIVPGKGNARSVTALQRAQMHSRAELATVLEAWGGDVALTPLHEAAAAGDLATVRHLLSWGLHPDQLGEFQVGVNYRTPLHWASIMGRQFVVAELGDAPRRRECTRRDGSDGAALGAAAQPRADGVGVADGWRGSTGA
ncbi:hypothetical protein PINS_up002989 [Pythium insidiosum]|nr:hypothetical protein PINS_up002989 [Pythium insidiosum]